MSPYIWNNYTFKQKVQLFDVFREDIIWFWKIYRRKYKKFAFTLSYHAFTLSIAKFGEYSYDEQTTRGDWERYILFVVVC